MRLKDKFALIPGASRPIGRAIARKFASEGASLFLPCYDDWPESTREMEEEFSAAGFSFFFCPVDLRDSNEVKQLAAKIKRHTDQLDFLINNIERGGMPVVHGGYELPQNKDQWDLEFTTTLKAKQLLYHHLLPLMNGCQGGAIVNISSVASVTGRSGPGAQFFSDGYSAANRAVQSFTESWAREAAPDLRVNELMLGLIDSRHGPGTRGWEILTEKEKAEIKEQILLKRTGRPEEVAEAVFFLAVDAVYITGATLKIDGGFSLGGTKVPAMPSGVL